MIFRFPRCLFIACLLSLFVWSCSDDGVVVPDPEPFEFLSKLSEYGYFTGPLANLEPAEGLIRYELATPLFSDYTEKDRFIVLPEGTAMDYRATGIVDFPPGTVIIKNFSSLDAQDGIYRLETRLLHLDPEDMEWKVSVYLWRDDQADADKYIIGKTLQIRVKNSEGEVIETTYRVPNSNDCKRCHNNQGTILPIGPSVRNLNYTMAGSTVNQLDAWAADGVLTNKPTGPLPQLPDWMDDAQFTLDQRARAYLDVNCAHCHTVGGDAYNTGLFLEYEQADSAHLGIYKTPVSAGPGSGNLTYDIVPGNAAQSIVHYRMNSNVPGVAMPELGREVIHTEGVELIRDWINSL